MATGKKSRKGKGTYAVYKSDGRACKNKVLKLQRHIKAHPEDATASVALANVQKHGYTGRKEPKRNLSRTILITSGKDKTSAVSLNLISGRLSYEGKVFQRLLGKVASVKNEMRYRSKAQRALDAKFHADVVRSLQAAENSGKQVTKGKRNKSKK